MANITFATTPTTATVVSAAQLNTNTYNPDIPASSFAEMNGRLVRFNTDHPTWKVGNRHIRNRSMGNGKMVGSTMTVDTLSSLNTDNSDGEGAFSPIAGAALTFFLPWRPQVCWITWQVITASDTGYLVANPTTHLRLFLNGVKQGEHFRWQPPSHYEMGRTAFRDRIWSGSYMYTDSGMGTGISKGWHTAYIGSWGGSFVIRNETAAGNSGELNPNVEFGGMCRFRVRNMKAFWLR